MFVLYACLYVFSWFLWKDANSQNVIPPKYVMIYLHSQDRCFERLVPSPDFPCHQVTKVAPLLTGQEEGPTISPAHLSWAWCSNPGHYLPFRGFQNFSCWQSRFLPKSYIRIMYYLKLLFILSPAFSRQNKAYSNYYQVFLGTPPNSPSLLLSVFVLNIKPIIRLDCIKIIEGMVKAMQYMISKGMFSIWPSDWW